jgi:uncharacterized protein (TIGR03083 family)
VLHDGWVPTAVTTARASFTGAADAFLDLVAQVPVERYDGPGLGDWDLRSLIGHTGRSLVTVATYLSTRADSVSAATPAAYFAVVSRVAVGDAARAIHQRGVEAGRALGHDPLRSLRDSRAAAEDALDRLDGEDPVVETAAGGMRVSDYLPTRTFELTVHCLDIATATGLPFEPASDALAGTVRLAADSALDLGFGVDVLLALTGRRPLPPGRSVVP